MLGRGVAPVLNLRIRFADGDTRVRFFQMQEEVIATGMKVFAAKMMVGLFEA